MPRDLFGPMTRPFDGVGARSRLTVALSLAAHVAVVAVVVVVPLLATDALPALHSRLSVSMITPIVPAPPPLRRATPPPAAAVAPANSAAAPLDAPSGITKEPVAVPSDADLGGIDLGADVVFGVGQRLVPEPPPPPPLVVRKPIRVGGAIQPPTKMHYVAPVYPAIAQQARVEGIVIIAATIGVDGAVVDTTVLKSEPLLAQAAVDAVKNWRFTPTRLNGEPVPVLMTVTVAFRLQ